MKEVKMPPLDGTPFVVIWCAEIPCSGMHKIKNGLTLEFSHDEGDYIYDPDVTEFGWECDLDARYFIEE